MSFECFLRCLKVNLLGIPDLHGFPELIVMSDLQVCPRPRLPLYKLLNADFGIGHDVTLRVFNGNGEVEGDLKAHCIILALGSSILEGLLFNKAGEMAAVKVAEALPASDYLSLSRYLEFFQFYITDIVRHLSHFPKVSI